MRHLSPTIVIIKEISGDLSGTLYQDYHFDHTHPTHSWLFIVPAFTEPAEFTVLPLRLFFFHQRSSEKAAWAQRQYSGVWEVQDGYMCVWRRHERLWQRGKEIRQEWKVGVRQAVEESRWLRLNIWDKTAANMRAREKKENNNWTGSSQSGQPLGSSPSLWHVTINPGPLGGAVVVCRVANWLQSAIETDEMWLQLQTDLKEAIESVWTVMGYPEHCRGARCNNEMHLFVFPPLFPGKMTGPCIYWQALHSQSTQAHTIHIGAALVVLEESLAA